MRNRPREPETFVRTLEGLSQPALAAFVADLWAARGWETTVVDGQSTYVVCTREDDRSTILLPEPRGLGSTLRRAVRTRLWRGTSPPPPSARGVNAEVTEAATATVDVVVSPTSTARAESLADDTGARVYDAPALSDLALYGLDRTEADALLRRHLGQGLEVVSPQRAVSDGPAETAGDASPSSFSPWSGLWFRSRNRETPRLRTMGTVVVAVVLAAVVAGGAGLGFGWVDGATTVETVGDTETETRPGAPGQTSATNGFGDADPFGTGPPSGDGEYSGALTTPLLAPGLSSEGRVRPETLAAAHASRVDGRSYVWRLSYTERSASGVTTVRTVHRVQNASVLRVDVETTGVTDTDPGYFAPRPAYADGAQRYVLSRGQVYQRPLESRDHYAGHAEATLARLLRANESTVRTVGDAGSGGTVRYEVLLSGSPDRTREAYRATALVAPNGVVRSLDAEWTDPTANVTVSLWLTYEFVDDANVTRPEWAWPATDNASASSSAPR